MVRVANELGVTIREIEELTPDEIQEHLVGFRVERELAEAEREAAKK